jgi:DNA invertase Pin-like site-specific DNA recombinase
MPEANDLTIHVLAAVGEHELKAISQRTKDALVAAKARGTRLGNPNGARALRAAGRGNGDAVAAVKAMLMPMLLKSGQSSPLCRQRG